MTSANGEAICSTCNDGIQNGSETGVDCGGPDCAPCCPVAGLACDDGDPTTSNDLTGGNCGCTGEICPTTDLSCEVCPDDIELTCSSLQTFSSLPVPVSLTGAGTYDMTIKFSEQVLENYVCKINTATFDNGCIGIKTACYNNTLKLTPDYFSCLGPLPQLPFTITFNGKLEVYFDTNGIASVISTGAQLTEHPIVSSWLNDDVDLGACGIDDFTHNFDPDLFASICDGENAGIKLSQTVTFKWQDYCGNVMSCEKDITIVNDSEPVVSNAGLNLYPNPAVNEINADLTNFSNSNVTVRITDQTGNIVYQDVFTNFFGNELSFNTNNLGLTEGIYNMLITGNSDYYESSTFLIVDTQY